MAFFITPTSVLDSQAGVATHHWFSGTIKSYDVEGRCGIVASQERLEELGKECFVHGDQLDPGRLGAPEAREGDDIIFPVIENDVGTLWVKSKIIPTKQEFVGKITSSPSAYLLGRLPCEIYSKLFGDVFLDAVDCQNLDTSIGSRVVFNIRLHDGRLQASSPRRSVPSGPIGAYTAPAEPFPSFLDAALLQDIVPPLDAALPWVRPPASDMSAHGAAIAKRKGFLASLRTPPRRIPYRVQPRSLLRPGRVPYRVKPQIPQNITCSRDPSRMTFFINLQP